MLKKMVFYVLEKANILGAKKIEEANNKTECFFTKPDF